jgi:hypothetical protein
MVSRVEQLSERVGFGINTCQIWPLFQIAQSANVLTLKLSDIDPLPRIP